MHGAEEATDVRAMVVDAKLPFDHHGYAGGSPDCAPKAEGLRPALQQMRQTCKLLGRQPGLGTRSRMAVQCLDALVLCGLQPLADCPRCNAQCSRNLAPLPALTVEFPRPEPTTLLPVVGLNWSCLCHDSWRSTFQTTFRYLCSCQ